MESLCPGGPCPCLTSAFGACTTALRRVDNFNCACQTSLAAISKLDVCGGFEFVCAGCIAGYTYAFQDPTICRLTAAPPTNPTTARPTTVPTIDAPGSPAVSTLGPAGLTTGATVGVAFGAIGVVAVAAAAGFFVWKFYILKVKGVIKAPKKPPAEQDKTGVQAEGEASTHQDGEPSHHPVHPPFSRLLRTILRRKRPEDDAEEQQAPPQSA